MLKAVIFDLDGTLVDSRHDLADATNRLIVEAGGTPLDVEAVVHMVGEGAAKLVARAFDAARLPTRPDSLGRFLQLYGERLAVCTRPYPGVPEMLQALSATLPLAVLTNKPTRLSERLLEQLGLASYIREVVGGDGPFPRKPNPAGLLAVCARLDAAPEDAVLVGDSKFDVRTARAAGARLVLVRYGFGFADVSESDKATADLTIDEPGELVAWARSSGTVRSQ